MIDKKLIKSYLNDNTENINDNCLLKALSDNILNYFIRTIGCDKISNRNKASLDWSCGGNYLDSIIMLSKELESNYNDTKDIIYLIDDVILPSSNKYFVDEELSVINIKGRSFLYLNNVSPASLYQNFNNCISEHAILYKLKYRSYQRFITDMPRPNPIDSAYIRAFDGEAFIVLSQ